MRHIDRGTMATSFGRGDLSPHPEKPLLYFSPMILARRRRLLKEARHMIGEDGLDGFSIRKLCQRAGVAQRTLYNAFQNKDRLIAFAIREAFDEFQAYVRTGTDPGSLGGHLSRTIAINRRNFRVRNYTKAVCAIYFAPGTPRDVWKTLQDMSLQGNRVWLEHRRADLNPWIDMEHFLQSFANVQYSTINDWCLGRLSDADYLPRLAENMLLLIVGAVHGELAEEADRYLNLIKQTGDVNSIVSPIADPPRRATIAEAEAETPPRRRRAAPKT